MADPRVLYVTGWTRSGSTLLGNVLGELPGVLHVGELHYLWRNGVARHGTNSLCGCGAQLDRCDVWSQVLEATAAIAAAPAVEHGQRTRLRTRHTTARLREARPGGRPPAQVRQTVDQTVAVYQLLTQLGGDRLIIDSSKFPAEAAALLARADLQLRVLHIVRDPRATAHSYQRAKAYIDPMSPLRSSAFWTAFNAASDAVGRAAPDRYLRIRHEDLCGDPRRVLAEVMEFAGLLGDPPVDDQGRVWLHQNHTVTGNPDRLRQGESLIRADERWRRDLTTAERLAATAAAVPLLSRYRYRLSPTT